MDSSIQSQISRTNSTNSSFGSSWISWCDDETENNIEESKIDDLSHLNLDNIIKDQLECVKDERVLVLGEIVAGKYKSTEDRLEAEKRLLFAALKEELLFNELNKEPEAINNQNGSLTGSVNISEIIIQHSDQPSRNTQYFLCVLSTDDTLFASQIVEKDQNGFVKCDINHTFPGLPMNFKIAIKIYIMKFKKKTLKLPKLSCCYNDEENYFRESCFKLWKETMINISHINKSHEFILHLNLKKSILYKMSVKVTGDITKPNKNLQSWVDVSKNYGLFWTERWCVLNGTEIQQFSYPVQCTFKQPIDRINLNNCIKVKIPSRSEWTRSRTLILEIKEDENVSFYYLSFGSKEKFDCWKAHLDKLVYQIQIWRRL